jgi:RNA polymerase sigma-70 factor (ECF subfamily)
METMTVPAAHQSSAHDTWVETYGDYLYGFAFYRVQDDLVAQELVQDTLVAALEARKNFSGKASEKTRLTVILKHKIMDLFRKKYRDAGLDGGDLDEREIHARFDHPGGIPPVSGQWRFHP